MLVKATTEMESRVEPAQIHCYTNQSFSRTPECIPDDVNVDRVNLSSHLPFQRDDFPPPPTMHQLELQHGQTNPAFNISSEIENNNLHQIHNRSTVNANNTNVDRYCYIDENNDHLSPQLKTKHNHQYMSLSTNSFNNHPYQRRINHYEYIPDHPNLVQRHQLQQQHEQKFQQHQEKITKVISNASMYEFINQNDIQQRNTSVNQQPQLKQLNKVTKIQNSNITPVILHKSLEDHSTTLGYNEVEKTQWNETNESIWNLNRSQIGTSRGCYISVPMQEEIPPNLTVRDTHKTSSHRRNNVATQKLHEILTTPIKSKMRSEVDVYSPVNSPHQEQLVLHNVTPTKCDMLSLGCSPSSFIEHEEINSPMDINHQSERQQITPFKHIVSVNNKGPTTSTPNKKLTSARRCLPLNNESTTFYPILRHHPEDNHLESGRLYNESQKKLSSGSSLYRVVEDAFIARTAVVLPISSSVSEANTTLMSGTEKFDKKNAPIILALVGILTCGLAAYLSWTQGRRYYFDSSIGCGACCALASACRSMQRTWTSLGLAGLSALSCAGLLLLAAESPRPGTPTHDITAGVLCGVSVLGAILALFAVLTPKCTFGRHRRIHSWRP